MTEAVRDATIVLSVVPTKATREVAHQLSDVLSELDQQIVLIAATKALEPGTYKRASDAC